MPVTCGFCSGLFYFEEPNFSVIDVVPLTRVVDVPFLQLYASRSGCETPQVIRNLWTSASPLAYTKLNCGYKTYCKFHLSPGRKDSHGHFFPECLVAAAIREHDIVHTRNLRGLDGNADSFTLLGREPSLWLAQIETDLGILRITTPWQDTTSFSRCLHLILQQRTGPYHHPGRTAHLRTSKVGINFAASFIRICLPPAIPCPLGCRRSNAQAQLG